MTVADIHRQYEILRETLLYLSHSERNQLHQINRWLNACSLTNEPRLLRSYVREVVSLCFPLIKLVAPTATSPELFSATRNNLLWVKKTFPDLFHPEEISLLLNQVLQHERTIYAYLGEPHYNDSLEEKKRFRLTLHPNISERDILELYLRFISNSSPEKTAKFNDIAKHWDKLLHVQLGCVTIPLIEQDITYGGIRDFQTFSTLALLQVHFHEHTSKANKDQFNVSNGTFVEGGNITTELKDATEAVRLFGREVILSFSPAHYSVSISLHGIRSQQTGRSFGLGYSVNLLTQLSSASFDKKYYRTNGTAVFSGRVDRTGTVLPIDEQHLERKMEGVLYSPYKIFIVPKDNERCVEAKLAMLQKQYPNRNVELTSVRHLRSVLDHRNAIHIYKHSIKDLAKKKFQQNQTKISFISIFLASILLLIYFLFILDLDKNPEHIILKDNHFVIQNKRGSELWRSPIAPSNKLVAPDLILHTFQSKRLALVVDLDGDNTNEVILGRPFSQRGFSDKVYCYNNDGSLLRAEKIGLPIITTEGEYAADEGFRVEGVAALNPDSLGKTKIIVATINHFYTGAIYLLDNNSSILSYYLHLGKLDQISVIRNHLTKREQVLLTGVSNGYLQPVLVILDPKHWHGACPQEQSHRLLSPIIPLGREIYYIKFPIPEIARIRGNPPPIYADIVSCDDSLISISTVFGHMPKTFKEEITQPIYLLYTLNARTLKPISVSTSSEYDVAHRMLKDQGVIHSVLDVEYKKKLLGEIEYWDGEKFVKTPTMNNRYVHTLQTAPR